MDEHSAQDGRAKGPTWRPRWAKPPQNRSPRVIPKTWRRSSNTRFPAAACVVTSSSSSRHTVSCPSFPAPLRFVPPWHHSTTYPEDLAPVVDTAHPFVGLPVPCLPTHNLPKDLSPKRILKTSSGSSTTRVSHCGMPSYPNFLTPARTPEPLLHITKFRVSASVMTSSRSPRRKV